MFKHIGKIIEERGSDIQSLFRPEEGSNTCYYGRVRNGKSTAATADIIALLDRGEIVYANWRVDFKGYNQQNSFKDTFIKWVVGKKYFFHYKPENFVFVPPDDLITNSGDITIAYLNRLVGVHLFIDEGQWLFSSLDKKIDEEVIEKMKLILHGGHYCRTLNIITQRPINISKNSRSQIHFWYKCEKLLSVPFLLLRKTVFEDMKDDLPDEGDEDRKTYTSTKLYVPSKKLLSAFDTHGMRAKDAIEVVSQYDVYETTFLQRTRLLASFLPFVGRFILPTSTDKAGLSGKGSSLT